MAQVEIKDVIAKRLAELAEQSDRSIDEVLEFFIQQYAMADGDLLDEVDTPGRASRLLEAAKRMNYFSGETDTSGRSREILDTEFGDYLENRSDKHV